MRLLLVPGGLIANKKNKEIAEQNVAYQKEAIECGNAERD